jgi:hypothetical protein
MAAADGAVDSCLRFENTLTEDQLPSPDLQKLGQDWRFASEVRIITSMDETSRTDTRDRSDWPVKVYRLGEEPSDDLSEATSPEERLAMMWELAERGWVLAGRSFPRYERENTPGRILRRGQ